MLFKYLIVKLKMLVVSLLCVADQIVLSFGRECSSRKEMIAPWDCKLCNKSLLSVYYDNINNNNNNDEINNYNNKHHECGDTQQQMLKLYPLLMKR